MTGRMYEAEVAFLGSLMLEPELMDEVYIRPEELTADPRHPKILEYFQYIYEHDGTIDTSLMLARSGKRVEKIGGFSYLTDLATSVPTTANFQRYQDTIRTAYLQRKTAELLETSAAKMETVAEVDVKDQIAQMQAQLEELAEMAPRERGAGLKRMHDVLDGHVEELTERAKQKGMTGPPTVSREMDKLTGGHQPGDLEIVAARPSMGKTAFMNNDAIKVARSGAIAAIFSAEMLAITITERVICSLGNLDSHKIRSGGFTETDWEKYSYARAELEQLPIYIDETPGMSIQHIKSEVRRLVKQNPGRRIVVYIDYLQLIPAGFKISSRREEVEYVSRQLKMMARQYGVTVVALSQLSRKVEDRPDKRPMLSDLRESGAIEQDADIITFLYRDDYYNANSEKRNIVEVIIAKGRNIGTGTVEMVFLKQYSKFVDMDRSHHQQQQKGDSDDGKENRK